MRTKPERDRLKILFLDVDGVLNNSAIRASGGIPLSSDALRRLEGLVRTTGARIVLSSTWRLDARDMSRLETAGVLAMCHTDPATPDLPRGTASGIIVGVRRGDEIGAWLNFQPEVSTWAIIDDEDAPSTDEQRRRFVRTDDGEGLTDRDVLVLVRLLGAS